MSTGLAIYAALGVTIAAILVAGYRAGRLRWFNVAAAVPLWPAVVIGGWLAARRALAQDPSAALQDETWARIRPRLRELPWKLRVEIVWTRAVILAWRLAFWL